MKRFGHNLISYEMLPIIFTLAWPTMLEQLMQTAVQYVDTAMVGVLGTQATAAVGATTTLTWLITGVLSALGIGFLTFIARSLGCKQYHEARQIAAQSVCVVLFSGIVFTVLVLSFSPLVPALMQVAPEIRTLAASYFFILYIPTLPRAATIIFGTVLRAAGDSKTPMLVGLSVNLINLVLNLLLIYPTRTVLCFSHSITIPGAGLGVAGAAAASAIAITVGGIAITLVFWHHPQLSPKGMKILPDAKILKPCMRVAVPNMFQRFATSLGYVSFASMINALGEVSAAAHTIANTVESAFYIPGYGMQTAASTLAGNAAGTQNKQRMQDLTRTILVIEALLMVLSGGLLFLFAPDMMSLFSDNPQVIVLGSIVLRMVAVSEPFFGISIIIEGILYGVGDTIRPFIYNVAGMWGIRIVGTFLCTEVLGMGLVSAWGCMILHNLFVFALFTLYCIRGKESPLNPSWNTPNPTDKE